MQRALSDSAIDAAISMWQTAAASEQRGDLQLAFTQYQTTLEHMMAALRHDTNDARRKLMKNETAKLLDQTEALKARLARSAGDPPLPPTARPVSASRGRPAPSTTPRPAWNSGGDGGKHTDYSPQEG